MSYVGYTVRIPLGLGGLDKSENKTAVDYRKLIEAENVVILNKQLAKDFGSTKQNSTAVTGTPAIIAGRDYYPTVGTKRGIIATADGKLFKDDGTFAWGTTLKSGLTADKDTVISEGGAEVAGNDKKLFFCNGTDVVQVLSADGATTGNINTPSTDWASYHQPRKMAIHRLRNWAIAGHYLYGSTTTNHEDFTGAGSQLFSVFPGEGDYLVNMVSIWGRLYLFKYPRGIYYLDDTDSTAANWYLKRVTGGIGSAGPNALDSSRDEAVFLSPEGGLHFLRGVEAFGDVKSSDLTSILNIESVFRDDATIGDLHRAHVVYFDDRKQVWVGFTSAAGTSNDTILKIDVSDMGNPKPFVTTKDECESIWIYEDPTSNARFPLLGDSAGFIRETEKDSRNVDGTTPYTGRFQTPYTDFGFADPQLSHRDKILDFLEIVAEPAGNYDATMEVYVDGEYSQTIQFNMGSAGAALDSFTLGTDRLDGAGVVSIRKKAASKGQRFSFNVYNSGLNQDFKFAEIVAYFRVADYGRRGD